MELVFPLVGGFLALGMVWGLAASVRNAAPGNETMQELSLLIQQGAKAFLKREYAWVFSFVVVVFILIGVVGSLNPETGRVWLPPIQITYESEVFGLPIRIGTLSAEEVQNVVIYALTDLSEGSVGISNYDEVVVEDECMFDSNARLDEDYESSFQTATEDGPGWVKEHSWDLTPSTECDP